MSTTTIEKDQVLVQLQKILERGGEVKATEPKGAYLYSFRHAIDNDAFREIAELLADPIYHITMRRSGYGLSVRVEVFPF